MTAALLASLLVATPLRIAVPPLTAHGVSAELAQALTTVVLSELAQAEGTQVIAEEDLNRLLDQEQRRQLLGCRDDASCMSRVVGAAETSHVVSGSVSRVHEQYIVALALLDTQTSEVSRRVTREVHDEAVLTAATREAAQALTQQEVAASRCFDCDDDGAGRSARLALLLANNFMGAFERGIDLSLLGPGSKLELAYRVIPSVSLFFGTGFSLGSADRADGDVSIQVVPLSLGARYIHEGFFKHTNLYAGIGLGVGFVRTVLDDKAKIASAFSGEAALGFDWFLIGGLAAVTEVSYQLTLDTPRALAQRPLSSAALRLGLAYAF